MKTYLLGLLTGLILAGGVVYAGSFYDSNGTQGVVIDQGGGSGFYMDSTGRFGTYQGMTPSTPVLPFVGKAPC